MNEYDLDKVIKVENALEPEKGGFYQAYKEHYQPAYNINKRVFDKKLNKLSPAPFDLGLKTDIPKLNIANGRQLSLSMIDVAASNAFFVFNERTSEIKPLTDFRVIDLALANQMGLAIGNEFENKIAITSKLIKHKFSLASEVMNRDYKEQVINSPLFDYKEVASYKSLSSDGFLISLEQIKDNDFVKALNTAAKLNSPQIPNFDNAKYEPQFKKLEQYLNHFNLTLRYQYFQDFDYQDQAYKFSTPSKGKGNAFDLVKQPKPWEQLDKEPFSRFIEGFNGEVAFPYPNNFRSENDFLKAGAHVIANALISDTYKEQTLNQKQDLVFKFSQPDLEFLTVNNKSLVQDLAGTMLAAQWAVPVSQNEISRFNSHFTSAEFPEHFAKQAFSIATNVVNHLKVLDLSQDQALQQAGLLKNNGIWDLWKRDNERHALQMATPSLERLCQEYKVEPSKENVMKALDSFVKEKHDSLETNKELHNGALKSDEPLSNRDIGKEQDKAAKEPVKGTREAAKSMER